jgi:hypothetical protein
MKTTLEKPKMFTREQYLDKECTHREYYSQFVNPDILHNVKLFIGEDRIKNSKDKHLNDISLVEWDNLPAPFNSGAMMRDRGDYLTPAGKVCIYKTAAKMLVEQ